MSKLRNRFGHPITSAEALQALAKGEEVRNRFDHPLTSDEVRAIAWTADEADFSEFGFRQSPTGGVHQVG